MAIWIFTLLYCCPWLYLTDVRPDLDDIQQCDFRPATRHFIRYYFLTDFVLFYLIPLLTAVVIYTKIGGVLQRNAQATTEELVERVEQSLSHEASSSSMREFPQGQNTIVGLSAIQPTSNVTLPAFQELLRITEEVSSKEQQINDNARERARSRAHVGTQ